MKPHPEWMKIAAQQYIDAGFSPPQTGRFLGVSATTVRRWTSPDHAKRNREASLRYKRSVKGSCVDCGAPTAYNGRGGASIRCIRCAHKLRWQNRRWTREAVIEAIQQWAAKHGRPPVATEWVRSGPDHPGASGIYGPGQQFSSWADAIEAAGFPKPRVGGKTRSWPQQFNLVEAIELRTKGLSDVEIGFRLGVPPTRIARVLGPRGKTPPARFKKQADRQKRNREQRIADLRQALNNQKDTP